MAHNDETRVLPAGLKPGLPSESAHPDDEGATVVMPRIAEARNRRFSDATVVPLAEEEETQRIQPAAEPSGALGAASGGTAPDAVETILGTTLPSGGKASGLSGTGAPATHTASTAGAGSGEQSLQIGAVLKERFVLEEVIGTGGMGVVFKALDLRKSEARDRDAYVALKVLNAEFRDDPRSLIALQRETKRAQTLSHPNIINVFDFDRDGRHVFMSMEYLTGRPLNQWIKQFAPAGLPFRKAWPIIRAMGEALAFAHRKHIVHSDFKPGNVFIAENDDVKVLDFGIACAAGRPDKNADATVFNARSLGALTPAYASLDMLEDQEPDPRDDIYALGCVTYELLSGKHPYGKLPADQALELNLHAKPIAGLTRRQWRALQRALAFRRENRIRTVEEFLGELQRRSPWAYAGWGLAFTALTVTSASVYYGLIAPPEPVKIPVVLTPEQTARITDLLELAAIHFDVGYLTAPTGSNALWAYQEVLKIDPYNPEAIKGMEKIANTLEQSAWESFERGNRAESLQKVTEGLEAVPTHPGLLSLRKKLER